jgi:2-amino-4-hydroxy-6-hydroxymethyldihydropteridine diphosphokinase
VYVAAGSNVRPLDHLRAALKGLDAAYAPLQVSPAYRNKAVGFEGDDFINLVVAFDTEESPQLVRERMQALERACGRPANAPKWAARTMDLDLLMYGHLISDEPGLVLPRPDLVRRPYMLKPMADLAPNEMHPTLGKSMAQLWKEFEGGLHEMMPVALEES